MESSLELNHVVRRVIAARVRDSHLVEDLSQETLVRVAAAQPRLSPDALQAYAIVTARNVIISHARTESVHDRHSHRLVDYTTLDGPEELALVREETDALAAALQQLDEADRDWLLRHEAEGVSTGTLAGEAGISSGAAAMRLARARATLRVEFVVAFRRVRLPTVRCRPVLLSLSAGDRRRQDVLDAASHLVRCPTCAQLARPVTERRRGIAAWLIVPAAEAVRRAFASLRRNRSTQIAMLGATTVIAAGIVILALPEDDGAEQALAPIAPATTPRNVAAAPPASDPSTSPSTSAPDPCSPRKRLEDVDPDDVIGCPIAPTTITVINVPTDEGFWARTAAQRDVWVQLIGPGESSVTIEDGRRLGVVGVIADPVATGKPSRDARIREAGYILRVRYGDVAAG